MGAGVTSMTNTTQSVTDGPLRLGICPGCGYVLNGLPDEGLCPECGREYDQRTVVLYGWSRGLHANVTTSSARVALGLWAMSSIGLIGQVFNPTMPRGLVVGMTAFWLGTSAWTLWMRQSDRDTPGRIQVHLSDGGCVQLNHPPKPATDVVPWGRIDDVMFGELAPGRYRLRLRCRGSFWKLDQLTNNPVDAEVQCTFEQADALRERIAYWRQLTGSKTHA
jgi:hypothetical protein